MKLEFIASGCSLSARKQKMYSHAFIEVFMKSVGHNFWRNFIGFNVSRMVHGVWLLPGL